MRSRLTIAAGAAMSTYTFHYYGRSGGASGLTFADFATDRAALREAERLLAWHQLGAVEVVCGEREVGQVTRSRASA